MNTKTEIEETKRQQPTDFLPSGGATCYASFTPGPWVFGEGMDADEMAVKSASGHWICFCFDGQPGKNRGNANGALIAAAPELLEALEHIVRYDRAGLGSIGDGLALAAIAKARGSSEHNSLALPWEE